MLFNSIDYLLFFPIVVALYFSIPHRYRWILLLVASYFFYMCWKPVYALLMLLTTLIDWYAAIKIEAAPDNRSRKLWLFTSILSNLLMLGGFKYTGFLNDLAISMSKLIGVGYQIDPFHILLPVGISFYTFQSMSYAIDVYRGNMRAEKNPGMFALYVSFFPQLVIGPIERSTDLLPQFYDKKYFDLSRAVDGMKLMLFGYFKKMVIADRLGLVVERVYGSPHDYTGFPLIIATYCFAFQVYCDFSGYTDIARGSAKVLGFRLKENFIMPYFATSINDFWRRWHITMSSWFRDYLYKPLGGKGDSTFHWYRNLLITFTVIGIWHGAGLTFLLFGLIHGIYTVVYLATQKVRKNFSEFIGLMRVPRFKKLLDIFITFHLVLLSYPIIAAHNINDTWYFFTHMFQDLIFSTSYFRGELGLFGTGFFVAVMGIVLMELIHSKLINDPEKSFTNIKPVWLRWSVYYILIYTVIIFGEQFAQEYYYFQF